jgi:cytoskeletal protein CcmA (bactofilin family)
MSEKRPTFVIPAGLRLEPDGSGVAIDFDGDVVLEATLGQSITRVHSRSGDVVIGHDIEVQQVYAPNGRVVGKSDLKAESLVAQTVEIEGNLETQSVRADSIRVGGDVVAETVHATSGGVRIGGRAVVATSITSTDGDIVIDSDTRVPALRADSGRVVIRGSAEFDELHASSDVVLLGDARGRKVESGGTVELHGASELTHVRGDSVRLTGPQSDVGTVQGRAVVSVGPGRVESDLFVAPVVDLSEQARG